MIESVILVPDLSVEARRSLTSLSVALHFGKSTSRLAVTLEWPRVFNNGNAVHNHSVILY